VNENAVIIFCRANKDAAFVIVGVLLAVILLIIGRQILTRARPNVLLRYFLVACVSLAAGVGLLWAALTYFFDPNVEVPAGQWVDVENITTFLGCMLSAAGLIWGVILGGILTLRRLAGS
jgi:hypothetical protein